MRFFVVLSSLCLAFMLSVASVTARVPPGTVVVETLVNELDAGAGGLVVDRHGNVYVAEFGSILGDPSTMGTRLFRVTPDGRSEVFVSGLQGASGNAIDHDGTIYQSNIAGRLISRISSSGEVSVAAEEGLRAPVGIAIASDNVLYVADCGGNTIAKVVEGKVAAFASDPLLRCPNGIVRHDDGTLYVSNFGNGDVLRVDGEGKVALLATLPGSNNGHLTLFRGALLVVARSAHQIYRISLDGEVEVFAGTGNRGSDNGPALAATFSFPNDIAVAPDGKTLYVNENGSITQPHNVLKPMRVRRIRVE